MKPVCQRCWHPALSVLRLLTTAISAQTVTQPIAMNKFVLLFRQGPLSPTDADKARRQAAIGAWARAATAAGCKLEPRSLAPESARPGLAAATEAVGTWPLTALVFLEARDFAEAVSLAAAHPAKDFNTSVEVRPWSPPAVSLLAP